MSVALATINGVRGYVDAQGTAYLHLEDVARGLGFTQTKGGTEYVRWETVYRYLEALGFSQLVGKEADKRFIPENVFYRLAMKANNETAEAFQALVADEILPAIRRTGVYDARIPRTLSEALRLAADQAEQIEEQQKRIALLTPAAEFGETIGSSKGAILIRDFVKLLANGGIRIGQNEFFAWLRDRGYIYRHNDQWKPYRRYVDMGLLNVVERSISTAEHGDIVKLTVRITGKGQRYFYDKLNGERTA
jgi:anti-repressor protein